MASEDTVWAETTAGGLLRQLFGYYPTLHDARAHSIEIDGGRETVTLDVDYTDRGIDGEKSLRVRMRLIWSGVKEAEFSSYDTDILEMRFEREGDLLRTRFDRGMGFAGSILSEGFEAFLEKVDPPDREQEISRIEIRYRA